MATLPSMAEVIPSSIPQEIRAGDTAKWRRELSDYPASDGWVLRYTLVGASAVHTVTATADGDAFAITVPAATTASWAAGGYTVQEYVTKDTDRYTLAATTIIVLRDLAALIAGTDLRTHARKVLDAIEAWLESKAPVAGSIEIAGRKISHYPITELLTLRDRYRAEAAREEAAASGSRGSRIYVRL